uniref:non-specific serine/threonine protein kinase n=2 Tax=Anabas testudineus TaxID=64144 RepID=A0A7N6ACJ1_ANATE
MTSKSWPTAKAVQWRVSSKALGHQTDPVFYAVENCTFKKSSDRSFYKARKKSRTSSGPSPGCSYAWREPQSSSALAKPAPPKSTGSTSDSSIETKKSGKRSSTSDEDTEGPRKRSREAPRPSEDHNYSVSGFPVSFEGKDKQGLKRKSEEIKEPRKRSRNTPSPCEGTSQQTATASSSNDEPCTSSSVNTVPSNSRAAFEAKYMETMMCGKGGFGRVYQGYRKCDNMPVAIKHIPQLGVKHTAMYMDGETKFIPVEVALMLQINPKEGQTSAAVTLLDWYDLDSELILVLERPVPCLDLIDYMNTRGKYLDEYEAKIIVKQLVNALIEVHSKGVFHGDIKLQNILIETGSAVPQVRLIDFGLGEFLTKGEYAAEQGTYDYLTPEWFQRGWYTAVPTTVWQLGVVVFGMLHGFLPFITADDIIFENPLINENLSSDCQGFINSCLVKKAEARPTLETLKHHPWLM